MVRAFRNGGISILQDIPGSGELKHPHDIGKTGRYVTNGGLSHMVAQIGDHIGRLMEILKGKSNRANK